jgi:hypothetical protein
MNELVPIRLLQGTGRVPGLPSARRPPSERYVVSPAANARLARTRTPACSLPHLIDTFMLLCFLQRGLRLPLGPEPHLPGGQRGGQESNSLDFTSQGQTVPCLLPLSHSAQRSSAASCFVQAATSVTRCLLPAHFLSQGYGEVPKNVWELVRPSPACPARYHALHTHISTPVTASCSCPRA